MPSEPDLIAFFGCEPALIDPDVPWAYNTLSFTTACDGLAVTCSISPSYEVVLVVIGDAAAPLVSAELRGFESLSVTCDAQREEMIVERTQGGSARLVLTTRPRLALVITSDAEAI